MVDKMPPKKPENTDDISHLEGTSVKSRRKFIIGAGAPVVLSMFSPVAFGATQNSCTISGYQSVAPSGPPPNPDGCGGYSPGAWFNPFSGSPENNSGAPGDGSDGNMYHWHAVGLIPPHPSDVGAHGKWVAPYVATFGPQALATRLPELLGAIAPDITVYEALDDASTYRLERFAACAFMSATLFGWGSGDSKIHPLDIIGLYETAPNAPYTTQSGNVVTRPTDTKLVDFFEQLQHRWGYD